MRYISESPTFHLKDYVVTAFGTHARNSSINAARRAVRVKAKRQIIRDTDFTVYRLSDQVHRVVFEGNELWLLDSLEKRLNNAEHAIRSPDELEASCASWRLLTGT